MIWPECGEQGSPPWFQPTAWTETILDAREKGTVPIDFRRERFQFRESRNGMSITKKMVAIRMSPPGGDPCQVETSWQPERFSATDIRLPPQGSEVVMQLLAAEEHTYNSHALKYLRDRTGYLHEDAYFADTGGAQSRRHN